MTFETSELVSSFWRGFNDEYILCSTGIKNEATDICPFTDDREQLFVYSSYTSLCRRDKCLQNIHAQTYEILSSLPQLYGTVFLADKILCTAQVPLTTFVAADVG